MIDVSHANCSKQHQRQIGAAADVAAQVAAGDACVMGVMIESHLNEGRQDILPGQSLKHGVLVADARISLEQTVPVLQGAGGSGAGAEKRGLTNNLTRLTKSEVLMSTWQLQEAKGKFSEVVKLALSKGPQGITVRASPWPC